jgi:hypothetical protein
MLNYLMRARSGSQRKKLEGKGKVDPDAQKGGVVKRVIIGMFLVGRGRARRSADAHAATAQEEVKPRRATRSPSWRMLEGGGEQRGVLSRQIKPITGRDVLTGGPGA